MFYSDEEDNSQSSNNDTEQNDMNQSEDMENSNNAGENTANQNDEVSQGIADFATGKVPGTGVNGSQPRAGGKLGDLQDRLESRRDKFNGKANKQKKNSDKLKDKSDKLREKAGSKQGKDKEKLLKKADNKQKKADKKLSKMQKYQKKAAKAGKMAGKIAKLGKIIAILGEVILAVIIIIGLLVFILTGMGYILGGLESFGANMLDIIENLTEGAENNVESDEIAKALSEIQEMDYDLYTYGFVREEDALTETEDGIQLAYNSETTSDTGDHPGVYDYITAYLVSDNYAYILKNSNENFMEAFKSKDSFLNGLSGGLGWGTGLISVYREEDGKPGVRGEEYGINGAEAIAKTSTGAALIGGAAVKGAMIGASIGSCIPIPIVGTLIGGAIGAAAGAIVGWFSNEVLWTILDFDDNTSSVTIDRNAEQLRIEGAGVYNDTVLAYNLEGWTGRYSMPLEFLLATHVATMAPDLSYKLATGFSTDVEILLHTSEDTDISAGLQFNNADNKVIERDVFAKINQESDGILEDTKVFFAKIFNDGDNADASNVSKSDVMQMYKEMNKKGIPFESIKDENSNLKCTGPQGAMENICQDDQNIEYPDENTKTNEEAIQMIKDNFISFVNSNTGWYTDEIISNYGITDDEIKSARETIVAKINNPEIFKITINGDNSDEDNYIVQPSSSCGGERDFTPGSQIIATLKSNCKDPDYSDDTTCDLELHAVYDIHGDHEYWLALIKKTKEVSSDEENGFNLNGLTCSEAAAKYPDQRMDACENCTNLVKNLYLTLNKIDTKGFETYVPYINRVTNHWYRNVYFTEEAIKLTQKELKEELEKIDGVDAEELSKINVIQTDDDYEKKTGERWTLYDLDDSGNYELYVYLKTDASGKYDDNGAYTAEFAENGKLVCRKEEGGAYYLDDNGVTYKKADGLDKIGSYNLKILDDSGDSRSYKSSKLAPAEFRVGKKAEVETVATGWTAYGDPESTEGSWKPANIEDPELKQVLDNVPNITPVFKSKMYTVEQIEDGVRGETNPTIKELFLDDYYIYDGTKERAKLIETAKKTVRNYFKNYTNKAETNEAKKTASEEYFRNNAKMLADDPDNYKALAAKELIPNEIDASYFETIHKKENGKDVEEDVRKDLKATLDEISGPISLTHTSLSAFSILKNMKTIDADYIYHDFKELIVELDYFDKEDLVEPEDTVLMFPVQGISSAGWPDLVNDKSEAFYGTLIQSAEDYEAARAGEEIEMSKSLGTQGLDPEESDAYENAPSGAPENSTVDTSSGTVSFDNIFLQACSDILKYEKENKYEYCVSPGKNKSSECPHSWGCGRAATFEESQKGLYNSCCATLVKWACKLIGIKEINTDLADGVLDSASAASDVFEIIPYNKNDLLPGDIVHKSHHVQVYAGKDVSTGLPTWFNNGSGGSIRQGAAPKACNLWKEEEYDKIIRIKDLSKYSYNGISGTNSSNSSNSSAEFEGFKGSSEDGDEYVVSPVTGEVLKYGVVERKNVKAKDEDGTAKTNKVGFIKIKALDVGKPGETCTFFGGARKKVNDYKDIDPKKWLEDNYGKVSDTNKKLEELGYDYFWEEYNDAGIAGHVLYIEGFDVRDIFGVDSVNDIDMKKNAKENINKLRDYLKKDKNIANCKYTTSYTVPNLLDDKREFELKVGEEAKKEAAYFVEKGKKLYIKEGAVIGKTYSSDPEENEGITKKTNIEVLDKKAMKAEAETTKKIEIAETKVKNEEKNVESAQKKFDKAKDDEKDKAKEELKKAKEKLEKAKEELKKLTEANKKDEDNKNTTEDVANTSEDGKSTTEDVANTAEDDSEEKNNVTTKNKKLNVGNYIRIIFRDRDDQVVENVEDYVEIEEAAISGTADIYATQLIEGESIEIPQPVIDAQNGYSISFEPINRKELHYATNWKDKTVQLALYNEWVNQGSVANDGTKTGSDVNTGLAIVNIKGKDYLPIAVKETFGLEGDYLQICLEDGTILDCVIADTKGTDSGSYIYEGLDYGHSDGSKCNILEVLVKGRRNSENKTVCDLDKSKLPWWGQRVTKITNGGCIFTASGPK